MNLIDIIKKELVGQNIKFATSIKPIFDYTVFKDYPFGTTKKHIRENKAIPTFLTRKKRIGTNIILTTEIIEDVKVYYEALLVRTTNYEIIVYLNDDFDKIDKNTYYVAGEAKPKFSYEV